jgi:hypothetical protein
MSYFKNDTARILKIHNQKNPFGGANIGIGTQFTAYGRLKFGLKNATTDIIK